MEGKYLLSVSVLLLALLGVGGCAPVEPLEPGSSGFNSFAHEAKMRKLWADKPYRELVKHMGREGLVMDIPRYGWPQSSAVVYGVDPATGCIDAFLVLHGDEPLIKDYFCR